VIAPKVRFIGDLVELRKDVREADFLIRLPEEACIGKTRAQNAFVPCAHEALRILGQIDHGEKRGGQFPAPLFDGEVFLVVTHHGDEDLVGQFEE